MEISLLQWTYHCSGDILQILQCSTTSNSYIDRNCFIDVWQFLLSADQQKHARIWHLTTKESIVSQRRQKPSWVVKYHRRLDIHSLLLSKNQRQFSRFTTGADWWRIEYWTSTAVLQTCNETMVYSIQCSIMYSQLLIVWFGCTQCSSPLH